MPSIMLASGQGPRISLHGGGAPSIAASSSVRIDRLPAYEGSTEVTPSGSAQILPTAGRSLESDILVNPIPSNYGRVDWNGAALTIS